MVRGRVERLVRGAFREHAVLGVATGLERDDAGHVRLKRQQLHVEHQLHVLGERIGDTGRSVGQLPGLAASVVRFDPLDPALELAHVVQVPIETRPVAAPQLPAHALDLATNPVEDAAAGLPSRRPIFGRAARSKQHVEGDPRVADHRQGFVRRRPADRVGVRTRVVVGAASRLIQVLDAELHRRHGCALAEALRVHLIHRRPRPEVGAVGLLRVRLRQEDGARTEVVSADFRQRDGLRHPHVGVADDREVVAIGLERAQWVVGDQREVAAGGLGCEEVLARAELVAAGQAVHLLDADEPRPVGCGRFDAGPSGGNHRVQERQRHRRPHAAEERPAGHMLSRDEVHVSSPLYGLRHL